MINVRGMHLTGVLRDMIAGWIALTVFSSAALTVPSVGTVRFPKDKIESLATNKTSVPHGEEKGLIISSHVY
jgi:hypothetical protein